MEARPSIMQLVVVMHSVVRYVFSSKKNSAFYLLLAFMLYFYYFSEYIVVQILIAKGASLTAENANGYVFLVSKFCYFWHVPFFCNILRALAYLMEIRYTLVVIYAKCWINM